VILRNHDEARCPYCGSELLYGVAEEPNAWMVHYECASDRCGREFTPGRIRRSEVDHVDEVYERAEALHRHIP
jgi:DNA-directed RNA polymerase subunit RPC12/RpoP